MNSNLMDLSNLLNIEYNNAMLNSFSKYNADHSYEHLACDEALLHFIEENQDQQGFLRFWEAKEYDVVLGASNKLKQEINEPYQNQKNIYRRCSGGGTVLQGPGCLNYAFILPLSYHPELKNLSTTNCFIMTSMKNAINDYFISKKIALQCEINGHTDLSIDQIKFSGNAQRRLQKSLLFHGTVLYNFDLSKIDEVLSHPPKEPSYRKERSHLEFIRNIPIDKDDFTSFMYKQFQVSSTKDNETLDHIHTEVARLKNNKYTDKKWTKKHQ